MFLHRRLKMRLISSDTGCSPGGSQLSSASGSPALSSASPRHLRLGTADALSVQEPAQRFNCSRRLVFAESPIFYSRRTVLLKRKHAVAGKDTPSMCILSLPGSCSLDVRKTRVCGRRERAKLRRLVCVTYCFVVYE